MSDQEFFTILFTIGGILMGLLCGVGMGHAAGFQEGMERSEQLNLEIFAKAIRQDKNKQHKK